MGIALVTGASSGIGREVAKQISKIAGIQEIWVIARRAERLEELREELRVPVRIFALDITKEQDVAQLSQVLEQEKPEVSWLANCAGFAKFGDFYDVRQQDVMNMIDLNIGALVRMTYLAVPYMPQGGRIMQIASTAAFQPLPDMNVYAATKAFVYSYSRALNQELQNKGISVTTVCPGWTKTEFFDVAEKDADKEAVHTFPFMLQPAAVAQKAVKDTQRGRELSICGIINKGHFFFSKILPDSFIMRMWKIMK